MSKTQVVSQLMLRQCRGAKPGLLQETAGDNVCTTVICVYSRATFGLEMALK